MTNVDLHLVNFVEKYPFLYDSKHEKSKDKVAIENAWKIISSHIGIPAKDCAERWLSLRGRFSKERSRIIKTGKNTDWPIMEHLLFLNGHVKKRRSFGVPLKNFDSRVSTTKSGTASEEDEENNFMESEIENVDVDPINAGYPMEVKPSPFSPDVMNENTENQLHEFVRIVSKQPEENLDLSNDDQYLQNFCDSLVSDLKCISDRKNLLKCKIEIMQVINKYLNET